MAEDKDHMCVCVFRLSPLLTKPPGFNHGRSTLMTLSNPDYLPETPPLSSIVRLSLPFLISHNKDYISTNNSVGGTQTISKAQHRLKSWAELFGLVSEELGTMQNQRISQITKPGKAPNSSSLKACGSIQGSASL